MIKPEKLSTPEIKDLIFDFYLWFSTFEFVIKNQSFLENREDASPHWDHFINEIKKDLPDRIEENPENTNLYQSIKYLMENPPKKQINVDGNLRFRDISIRDFDGQIFWNELFAHIRRVRNNLFHGEKEPFNNHRDIKLIWCSLEVMKFVSSQETQFKNTFDERFWKFPERIDQMRVHPGETHLFPNEGNMGQE